MATVTGKTSERLDALLASSLVSGSLNALGQLTFATRGGSIINAGSVSNTLVNAVVNTLGRLIITRRDGTTFDAGYVGSLKPFEAWPVGSIFMSTSATSPATSLGGGTWVPWGAGRVPVSVNSADLDFSAVEKMGGEKSVGLNEANLPIHNHSMTHQHPMPHTHDPLSSADNFMLNRPGSAFNRANGSGWHGFASGSTGQPSTPNTGDSSVSLTGQTGGSAPHNNLQPYITCYMWKRTA